MLVLLTLWLISGASAQTRYQLEYTTGTSKTPIGIASGYNYKWLSTEAGTKTNWNEYYTLFYASAGAHTTGRIFLEGMAGYSYTASCPTNKNYDVGVWQWYYNAKIGYKFGWADCWVRPYVGYSRALNDWKSVGLIITSKKE